MTQLLDRPVDHLQSYVTAELGTDGNMNEQGGYIIKGRYYARNIETLLRKYIKEYVMCEMCRGVKTKLVRDVNTRLWAKMCNTCGASRNCASIKTGYQAVAKGQRKKARFGGGNVQVQG